MSRRVLDIDSGIAMVVTDLHGAWDVYCGLRDRFLAGHRKGEIDRLVLCGDLIHGEGSEEIDGSLDMMLDVMALQSEFGSDTIIMLLGNHEMPHIYGLSLAKGAIQYTPRFEASLTRLDQYYRSLFRRKNVVDFLASLPFFVRTKGGVMLTHAGASTAVGSVALFERLLKIDHFEIVASADRELHNYDIESLRRGYAHFTGISYEEQAQRFLAVSGPEDPRFNDLLRVLFLSGQNTDFDLLWNTLFSQNELDGNSNYTTTIKNFLNYVSKVSPFEQRVLVAGHIGVKGGFGQVGPQQLRLASYTHAFPKSAGQYLLLDCAKEIHTATDLIPYLHPVMDRREATADQVPVTSPTPS
ncbi:MAG: metallophosphoesterase [Anaerolineae bacterium]|nr:metallophosphoesterase [Anaerolineae bacterium]